MLLTKVRGIRSNGSGEDFRRFFLPYMGVAVILDMCQTSYKNILMSLYLKAYIYLVKTIPVVSEKSKFYFLYVNDFGPRSRIDVDLEYSHLFIKSTSCLNLPTFRSQSAIVSEKSTGHSRQ